MFSHLISHPSGLIKNVLLGLQIFGLLCLIFGHSNLDTVTKRMLVSNHT